MPQNIGRKLRIIKDISEISHSKPIWTYFLILALILGPLLNIGSYNPPLVGPDTDKLIKDSKEWDKGQFPFRSWTDKGNFLNVFVYKDSKFYNRQSIDIFLSTYDIRGYVYLAYLVIKYATFGSTTWVEKFGKCKLLLFVLITSVLWTTYFVANISFIELMVELFDNAKIWVDNRVYDTTFALNIDRSSCLPHPFTMGLSAPYFLYTYHRYLMEDVVFTCEFMTSDVSFIYKRTQWRKNGAPLRITNDRIFVNVTMRKLFDLNGMVEFYIIVSKLTIQLLEESDFGRYTCAYQNPFNLFHFIVKPGPSMNQDFPQSTDTKSQPMSPDTNCNCKPKEQNYEIYKSQTYVEKFQCFAEFNLLKREEKVITKSISPGSIVISSAFYSTISGSDDVEIQISNKGDENEADCCSIFVEIYWRFFRDGYFIQRPPLMRILHAENGLYFYHYQCMCKSSYGTREFKIHRKFFNSTLGRKDMAEIIYPIKLKLFPEFTTPWSSTETDDAQREGHKNSSCHDSDISSHGCLNYFNLFESSYKTVFIYEYIIIGTIIGVLMIAMVMVCCKVRFKCIKPISRAILFFNIDDTPFESANGTPLRNLRPCRKRRHNGTTHVKEQRPQFQIYLSYDEENEFDLMIAEHIKGILLSMNMSVFDFQTDVLPGRSILTEIENAIINSSRFVVITSESYVENKTIEFDAIQSTIVGQVSRLKDRLLIIKSEDCDIERLYRVPCIQIAKELRDIVALDEQFFRHFYKWEKSTRPHDEIFLCKDLDSNLSHFKNPQIILAISIMICFIAIIAIRYDCIRIK